MAKKRNINNSIRAMAMSFVSLVVRLAILAVCILVIYRAGQKAYDFGYRIFTEEPMSSAPGRDVAITVVQGDSLMDTCEMLEEKGLVRDAKLTWIQKKVSVYDDDIQPGFYTLNTSMTTDEMFAMIAGKKGDDEEEAPIEATMEAAPLTDGEVDMDSIIDSTIPEDGVINDPFDEVTDDSGEGQEAEGEESSENPEE